MIDNPKSDRVKRVAGLARPAARERSGRFLIEGPQSVREAVTWRPDVVQDLYVAVDDVLGETRYASDTLAKIVEQSQDATIYVHKVTRAVMEKMSKDAQGIVAVGNMRAMHADAGDVRLGAAPRVAAFWQVRDPGNAGTVIRAADAAGCDAVVFVDDCVDPLNPKVIRSTAGSLFHIPVLSMDVDGFLAWAGEHGMDVIAADVYGTPDRRPETLPALLAERADVAGEGAAADGVDHAGAADADSDGEAGHAGDAVLFGNEARGLPPEILARVDRIVSIPLYGKAESLNLGTSAAVMLMSLAMAAR